MNIAAAHRIDYLELPKPASSWTKAGLRYERSVYRAIAASSACLASHNPQFYYITDGNELKDAPPPLGPNSRYARIPIEGCCIPDFVLTGLPFLSPDEIIILECKLTYKIDTADKLLDLYVPVVRRALSAAVVWPIIVAKNLTPDAPAPSFSLEAAWIKAKEARNLGTSRFVPVVQWLGRGQFPINARTEPQNS
jgi:hypothetical protein